MIIEQVEKIEEEIASVASGEYDKQESDTKVVPKKAKKEVKKKNLS